MTIAVPNASAMSRHVPSARRILITAMKVTTAMLAISCVCRLIGKVTNAITHRDAMIQKRIIPALRMVAAFQDTAR
jgi:hypothetical protein